MHNKNFTCPNCNFKFNPLTVFKIKKIDQDFECSSCKKILIPKMNKKIEKYWKYGFFIGIIFSVIPAQTYLIFDKNLPMALLIGLFSGLFILGISVYIVYKTTFFKLK